MHLVSQTDTRPIEREAELEDYFRGAGKPREQWRVGSEHEVIGVRDGGVAPAYDGPGGIGRVLDALAAAGWEPVVEGGHTIALIGAGGAQVTIEPGGQLELAARPVSHADEMKADLMAYTRQLVRPSRELGLSWVGVGFRPFGRIDDVPWMPKQRYEVMRAYMPGVGTHGHEMMKRTATVQVNLDYADADDAAEKLRATLSATSLLTAIFACSPIVDGAVSGYQSYRARVWRDTDNDRCGLLPFAFPDGGGSGDLFADYTRWALDVPMYFVHRGSYLPAGGMTFRRFVREGWQGHRATLDDWALHLSTLFPDARIKKFLEVRGCDSGSIPMVLALAPLCRGLLYDDTARRATIALTESLSMADREALADAVPRQGFAAPVGDTGHSVGALAAELVAIAVDGLERACPSELPYLDPVREIVDSGRTQADAIAALWTQTDGDPGQVIRALAHRCLGPAPHTDDDCGDQPEVGAAS